MPIGTNSHGERVDAITLDNGRMRVVILNGDGMLLRQGVGLALETQHFPDRPHPPAFPSTRLRPGETLQSRSLYRFSVID